MKEDFQIDFEKVKSFYLTNLEQTENIKLDKWQKGVLEHEGSISIRAGRQVGKSTVIGIKSVKFALEHAGTKILIIAASQRQSSMLFEKVKTELQSIHEWLLKEAEANQPEAQSNRRKSREEEILFELKYGLFIEPPTQTKAILKNKTEIYALPAGKTGYFIRGFSLDLLIADEAAYIPETVWTAVRPMIAVSQQLRGLGWTILLSTPFGKGGFFYESFTNTEFKHFHVSSEECPRIPRDFLKKEKERISKTEYAQEYLAEFTDEFNQLFPTELIKKCMTFMEWKFEEEFNKQFYYYLGVDIARFGDDENAFVIAEMNPINSNLKIVLIQTNERKNIVQTVNHIIDLDSKFHFRKIFTDDTGVGGGVTDLLLDRLGKKVMGINNASRISDGDGKRSRIMKEDLYSNALVLMEKDPPTIELQNNLKLLKSLKSMTYEYTSYRNLQISGNYSHIAEAFVRACWCVKAKSLNLFIV